ncbi:hypothetical protein CERSUDRAFT_112048 [Gelatoporia subvermispora B]|uniref:RING-CH-type domain-containing protein n=1 Tax=Ceriporiopsis subvermispora (strain B) TaxID=914234 RepID=M2R5B5_CERS8|nr:hypothetical protein CERSUDRAFT_112048 [Gelatoporia subvermispora B]
MPTIDDLRVKRCYICCEEESFDEPSDPPRQWVHPCRCTLIAHTTCLLQWMQGAQEHPSRAANHSECPQCKFKYVLRSDRPLLLRFLDSANDTMSTFGKYTVLVPLVATGLIGAYETGKVIVEVSTRYGVWAFKQMFGEQMFSLILTRDPGNWPSHARLFLPMIASRLIELRRPGFDALSVAPLFLAWSATPPARGPRSLWSMLSNPWGRRYEDSIFGPLVSWPPSPIMVTALYPLVTGLYRLGLYEFRRWLLGMPSTFPILPTWAAIHGLPPGVAALGRPADGNANQNVQQAGAANQNQERDENNPAVAAQVILYRASFSLMRFACGSLAMPAIANFMGSILYRLADRSSMLYRFLAIKPPLQKSDIARLRKPLLSSPDGIDIWGSLKLIACGTRAWAESDPVWWRNMWGMGIFCIFKDGIELLHLYLKKRELESQEVADRPFDGVDINELDLIKRPHPPLDRPATN